MFILVTWCFQQTCELVFIIVFMMKLYGELHSDIYIHFFHNEPDNIKVFILDSDQKWCQLHNTSWLLKNHGNISQLVLVKKFITFLLFSLLSASLLLLLILLVIRIWWSIYFLWGLVIVVAKNCSSLICHILYLDPAKVWNFELVNCLKKIIHVTNFGPVEDLSLGNILKVKPIFLKILILNELPKWCLKSPQKPGCCYGFLNLSLYGFYFLIKFWH